MTDFPIDCGSLRCEWWIEPPERLPVGSLILFRWAASDNLFSPFPDDPLSQALGFSLSHETPYLPDFLPTLPPSFFLSFFLPLGSFPSSLSPFGHMSPSLICFSSSGLFLKVYCYLVGTWQKGGTRSIKILLRHGMKSKSPLSTSQGLRIISTPVLAQGIT